MSGIAGIYHLDQHPVDRPLLERMLDCIPHRGCDGVGSWVNDFIGLGHRQFCTTDESLREVQPVHNRTNTCWVTFDGRIDNREELIHKLEPKIEELKNPTDVDLLLHAYDIWGTECLKWIIGDFAFALWDIRKQYLFCGRDIYGLRSFYYHFDGKTFTFGSDVHQIFQNPNIPLKVNDGKIAEWFTRCGLFGHLYREVSRTYFQDISELPFAHYLVVNNSGLQLHRYWDIDPSYEIRYRRNDEYIEHFLHLFQQAVHSRLRSCGPVGAELSGGFDSSSIVCIAQEMLRSGKINKEKLATFSLVFDLLSCDERPLINAVVRKYQVESHYVVADDLSGIQNFPPGTDWSVDFNNPEQIYLQKAIEALYRRASEHNIRVMLSGEGAESHVLGSELIFDSLIRHSQWRELFSRFQVMYAQGSLRAGLFKLLKYGLIPLLPKPISSSLYYRWMHPALHRPYFPDWFIPSFYERLLQETSRQRDNLKTLPKFQAWSCQAEYEVLNPAHPVLLKQFPVPIERRFPYHDRRLVEFGLAIPPEQKYYHLKETRKRNLRGRALQRQALLEILPTEIWQSQVKVNFYDAFSYRLIRSKDIYFKIFAPPATPLVSKLGYINREKFWNVLSDSIQRAENSQQIDHVRRLSINHITLLEIWLQTLTSQSTNNSLELPNIT